MKKTTQTIYVFTEEEVKEKLGIKGDIYIVSNDSFKGEITFKMDIKGWA